jgi:spermidine/putrescine transport system ATP-binding protein
MTESKLKTQAPAVHLHAVSKSFGETWGVRELDLAIDDGEFFSLLGPSGCGKTTTLRMIAGFETPTAGTILLHGRDVTREPAFRRRVNTVFQNYALFPHLSVFENVAFGLRERKIKRSEIADRVSRMLELVALVGRDTAKPRELSGGQQQRVALARALVLNPEVLLLDEPLGALDLALRRQMQVLLSNLQRELGITFIYVTHDQEEAFSMSSRVGVMDQGELIQVGTPQEIYHRPATPFVARFSGAFNLVDVVVDSQSGSRYEVRTVSGEHAFSASGPELLDPTSTRTRYASIRPEDIAFGANDEPTASRSAVSISGRILHAAYGGSHSAYTLETDLGVLKMMQPHHGETAMRVLGEEVTIEWAHGVAWLIAEPPAVAAVDPSV